MVADDPEDDLLGEPEVDRPLGWTTMISLAVSVTVVIAVYLWVR